MGEAQKIKMAAMTTHLKPHLFFYVTHAMPHKKRPELHVVTPAVLTLPPASVITLALLLNGSFQNLLIFEAHMSS